MFKLILLIFAIAIVLGVIKKNKYNKEIIFFMFLILFSQLQYSLDFGRNGYGYNISLNYMNIIITLIGGIYLFSKINNKNKLFDYEKLLLILISLEGFFYLITVNKYINISTATYIVNTIVIIFLIGLLCFRYMKIGENDLFIFYQGINILAIVNTILGLLQVITGKAILPWYSSESLLHQGIELEVRAIGIVGSNNGAGNFAAILGVILLFAYLKTKKKLYLLGYGCNIIFIVLTKTRTGMIAFAVGNLVMVIMAIYKSKYRKMFAKILLISILVGLVALIPFIGEVGEVFFSGRGNTMASRFVQFEYAFKHILNNFANVFWGVGAGQFEVYSHFVVETYIPVASISLHSEMMNCLIEGGVFTLISYIMLIILIIRRGLVSKTLDMLIIPLMITYILFSNFNPNQYYIINNVLLYVVIFIHFNNDNINGVDEKFENEIISKSKKLLNVISRKK